MAKGVRSCRYSIKLPGKEAESCLQFMEMHTTQIYAFKMVAAEISNELTTAHEIWKKNRD